MKKLLLFVAVATFSMTVFGQKIWNLGGDASIPNAFPTTTGIASGTTVIINDLSITSNVGGTAVTNMGAVNTSSKTFTDTNSKTFTFVNRFQFNGGGYEGSADTQTQPTVNMPTKRFVSFQVNGNSTIYAIGITGSNTSSRKIFVTDGTNLIGTMDFPGQPSGTPPLNEATVNYTGPAATLYMFCNAAVNLYYMSATNVIVTGVNTINTNKKVVDVQHFDILGKKINENAKGMVIQKVTYDDGTVGTVKSYIKDK